MLQKIVRSDGQGTTVLIRLMVGVVFMSEGIQKFLFADQVGAGRFARIGLPNPELLGPIVGSVEITCGILILLGLLTRMAAVPLMVIMIVAMAATKAPVLATEGFWPMMHGSRTDWAMCWEAFFY